MTSTKKNEKQLEAVVAVVGIIALTVIAGLKIKHQSSTKKEAQP